VDSPGLWTSPKLWQQACRLKQSDSLLFPDKGRKQTVGLPRLLSLFEQLAVQNAASPIRALAATSAAVLDLLLWP
jgi:hypothetical protein